MFESYVYISSINRISPLWARAGCKITIKKQLCLYSNSTLTKFSHEFIHLL